jgi:hypothetical protein
MFLMVVMYNLIDFDCSKLPAPPDELDARAGTDEKLGRALGARRASRW